ncbi:hypothetical protein QEH59_12595 [Coraliomargarita sp. SDUM461004]|uniref:Uncharacterized protein n=1 Tax=Thalassobacterium sedimentorum TaxID=3041258 RepID=A0ABU1AKC6_9BACT|nr:hypothetical protein [Coraliomargarita sp. SDUM461004]MDQ8195270.1 hypothetical protein [Coraliomargarita sp. SDUM461004]
MKKFLIFLITCVLLQALLVAETVTLKSKDGRSLSGELLDYSKTEGSVTVKIEPTGKKMTFQTNVLDAASVKLIESWYQSYAASKMLYLKVKRESGDKGAKYYEIELSSRADAAINKIRVNYQIPVKLKKEVMVSKATTKTVRVKGRRKTVKVPAKYKDVFSTKVEKGEIEVPRLEADSYKTLKTPLIATNGSDGERSVKGLLISLYVNGKLIEEFESQNGVKELIRDY